jgi:hypothetical protein
MRMKLSLLSPHIEEIFLRKLMASPWKELTRKVVEDLT